MLLSLAVTTTSINALLKKQQISWCPLHRRQVARWELCESEERRRQSACGATGDTSTERIPAQRSHSWHYCILAGSQGDAPRRRCEQKSGRGHSGRTQSQRKTRKVVFRKKLTETFSSAADTTGRNSAISCRIYPSNTTSHLIHPCHCTTHREGLSSQGCTNKDTPWSSTWCVEHADKQPANGSRNDWKDLGSRERHLNRSRNLTQEEK